IADPSEPSEGDKGPIAALNVRPSRHCRKNPLNLLWCRHRPPPRCLGNSGIFFRQSEIVSIRVANAAPVTGLLGKPQEEDPQGVERLQDSCLAKGLSPLGGECCIEVTPEGYCLLDVELLEATKAG